MAELISIEAKIKLFAGQEMRQTPFRSGYRPLFSFRDAITQISGRIDLINSEFFAPGQTDIVEVTFIKGILSENFFKIGEQFTFSEGQDPLGRGQIIEILKN
jgi:translation elongation factor EF-Tu-like GTPase